MRHRSISLLFTAAIFPVTSAAHAQGQVQSAGFGALKRTFDMTALAGTLPNTTADDGIRAADFIDGLLYVASNGSESVQFLGNDNNESGIYIVDPATTVLIGWFSVADTVDFVSDLDKDLDGNILVAGDDGVAAFDRAGNRLGKIRSADGIVSLPRDDNGNPVIRRPSLGGVNRFSGLAFDPDGDSGDGSIFVGGIRPTDPIFEIRVSDGSTIQEFSNQGWTCAGLTLDPLTGNLWCNSEFPETILELQISNDLIPTGNVVPWIPLQPGEFFSKPSGLGIVPGGDPGSPWASQWDLVSVSQQINDYIGFHRVHQIPDVAGYDESFLAGSTGPDPIARSTPALFGPGDTLNWGMVHNGRGNYRTPAFHFINIGTDATMDATTDGRIIGIQGKFPELVALSPFSVPATGNALLDLAAIVGDPDAVPPLPTGITSVTLPPSFPVNAGDVIRMQSVYFDWNANLPVLLAASNEFWFLARD